MLTHWVRQQTERRSPLRCNSSRHRSRHIASQSSSRPHQRQGTGVADRETPRNSESPTFSQFFFFLPLRDSGSTETAVRMSLRCPQVCATGRLERPLQCVVVILRLAARRIMLVPHEWTLSHSREIVVVVASIPRVSLSLYVVPECDGLKRLAVHDGWPRSCGVVQHSTTQAGAPVAHALASRATQRRNGPG